ncbi:MAG: MFS transporter [Candidatus Thorarchaeota archaeon]|nr:MFS transporter [Candidatus Thorarchaeota archaeon]
MLSSSSNESGSFRHVLRNHDYARLWTGQLVSNIGAAISSLALLFYVYQLTQSPMAMAILAIVETAPVVMFAGFIGVYIDRWDRKTIMIVSDVVRAVLILLIPLAGFLSQIMPAIYWVYLFTFLYAIANAWFYPARNASIPNLVESEELVTANSLSQMTFQVVQLAVPPIGGVLVALLAPNYFLAFAINSLTYIISAIALLNIRTSLFPEGIPSEEESVSRQVLEGAKFVSGNIILLYLFVFAILLASSSGILNALLLPHLESQVGVTEMEFGIVLSAGAASGTLVAFLLGKKKRLPYPLYIVASSGFVAGIAVFGLASAQTFCAIIFSWALIGSVDVMINIPLGTLMQELVPDNYRGRIFALLNVVFTAIQVLGMAIGGVWAEAIGSTVQPLFAAAIALVLVSLLGIFAVAKARLHITLDIMLQDPESEKVARDEIESSEVLLEVKG